MESNCRLLNRHVLKDSFKHTAHLLSEVSLLLQVAVKWSPPGGPCRDRKGEGRAEECGRGRGKTLETYRNYYNCTLLHVYNSNQQQVLLCHYVDPCTYKYEDFTNMCINDVHIANTCITITNAQSRPIRTE